MSERRKKILAVDDSVVNLAIVAAALEGRYDLQTCKSGEEGLEIMANELPDLVLLDVIMPGIDGYETCRRIRANHAMRHTMVILVSERASTAERLKGYEAGADDYVVKPFDSEELLAKIRVFLRLKIAEEVGEMQTDLIAAMQSKFNDPLAASLAQSSRDAAEEGQRLSELAQRGLTYCRLRNGLVQLASDEFDLAAAMVEAAGTVTDIFVVCRIPSAESFMIRADARLLRTAVRCIIDGAVKFAKSGRGIHFEVELTSGAACKTVVLRVIGSQFEAEWVDLLFDPTALQGQSSPNINLLLAREVLRAHGGDLVAESDDAGELLLRATFPVEATAPVSPSPDTASPS